jgi:hypothetical protein
MPKYRISTFSTFPTLQNPRQGSETVTWTI